LSTSGVKLLAILLLTSSSLLGQVTSRVARHIYYGSSVPATCNPLTGDVFYKTGAPNLGIHYCSASNTWTPVGAGGGGAPGGATGDVQYNDGAAGFTAEAAFNYTAASNLLTIDNDSIGETTTPSLSLENNTAAALDTQQYAPALKFSSNIWDQVGADSDTIVWTVEGIGNQQATTAGIVPNFRISYEIDGGGVVPWFHSFNHEDGHDADFSVQNLFWGIEAGSPSTMTAAAMANIGIGSNSLGSLTGGNENAALGNSTLFNCTTCFWNTTFGNESGIGITTGSQNSFFGQDSGKSFSLINAILTGAQNTHVGTQSGPASPSDPSNTVCIGYQCRVEGDNQGVLGNAGMSWAAGGYFNPDKTLLVADRSSLGAETLDETDFATHASWNVNGDFSDSGGNCAYTHSIGNGNCTQPYTNFVTAAKYDQLYEFTFTISGYVGDPACQLVFFADPTQQIYITQGNQGTVPNGTWTMNFRAAASDQDFSIGCTSDSGDDTVTFDDVSLKAITDGDVEAVGDVLVRGSLIGGNGVDVASATTTALGVGNVFHITGTTAITTLNTCDVANQGRTVTLIFDGILTFTDGNNLKLAGNFSTSADDTIALACDGSNWYEVSRSVN
jgi:hypothetical protein